MSPVRGNTRSRVGRRQALRIVAVGGAALALGGEA